MQRNALGRERDDPKREQREVLDGGFWHLFQSMQVQTASQIVRQATTLPRMENELMKRVMWSGLLTAVGALASIITQRAAAQLWRRVFDEEPPE